MFSQKENNLKVSCFAQMYHSQLPFVEETQYLSCKSKSLPLLDQNFEQLSQLLKILTILCVQIGLMFGQCTEVILVGVKLILMFLQ